MVRFKCSSCGFEKDVPSEYAGQRVRCPRCKAENQVGTAGADKPAEPSAPSRAVIKFYCPMCDQKIGVAAEHAGKNVRCPKCRNPVAVPHSTETRAPAPAAEGTDELRLRQEPAPAQVGPIGRTIREMPQPASIPEVTRKETTAERTAMIDEEDAGVKRSPGILLLGGAIAITLILMVVAAGLFITGGPPHEAETAKADRFAMQYIGYLTDANSEQITLPMSEGLRSQASFERLKEVAILVNRATNLELKKCESRYSREDGGYCYALTYEPNSAGEAVAVNLYLDENGGDFRIQGLATLAAQGGAISMLTERGTAIIASTEREARLTWRDRASGTFWGVVVATGVMIVLLVECSWYVLFRKLGYGGWQAFVPFYNLWVLSLVSERPKWAIILAVFTGLMPVANMWMLTLWGENITLESVGFVPIAGGLVACGTMLWISLGVAQEFEKGVFWGIGLWLLPWLFYPGLAILSE